MSDHLFKPGQSGNPAGKPKGAGDKRLEIRRQLEARGTEVVAKLLEMALDGDPTAMKLVMERISPKPRAESVNLGIQVNSLNGNNEIRSVVEQVLESALKGDVPDDQGKSVSSLVKTLGEINTRIEDSKRLEVIEEKLGIK